MIELRDYQREAVDAVFAAWEGGSGNGSKETPSVLVSLPTGTGKTVILVEIIARLLRPETGDPGSVLLLAHRDHLVRQPLKRMEAMRPWMPRLAGVVKASENQIGWPITIGSVQTIRHERRLLTLPAVDAIITDEAHHAAADSYQRIYARMRELNPAVRHVGFTATAWRNDHRALGDTFQTVAYQRSIREMVSAGWLVPPRGIILRSSVDLAGVPRRDGDYARKPLAERVNVAERNGLMLAGWRRFANGLKTLAFCAGVEHARAVADVFSRAGIPAASIDATTPHDDRARLLRDFESGELLVLTNYDVLTEGLDIPSIECVLMARPSENPTVITQALGRGLRLAPGKTECLALFVHDRSARVDLAQLPDLLGGDPAEREGKSGAIVNEAPVRDISADGIDASEALFFSPEEIRGIPVDLLSRSPFSWSRHRSASGRSYWSAGVGESRAVLVQPDPDGSYSAYAVSPDAVEALIVDADLESALMAGEARAREEETPALARRKRAWRDEDATDAQRDALWRMAGKRLGARIEFMARGEASETISFYSAIRALRRAERAGRIAAPAGEGR